MPVTVLDLAAVAEPARGEELAKLEMNAGGRPETTGSMMLPVSAAPRLADLGISKTQSSRWQAVARVPRSTIEAYISSARTISTARALKLAAATKPTPKAKPAASPLRAKDTGVVADMNDLVKQRETFGTLYIDPPWLYSNQGTRAATSNHYEGMTVEEICALPVAALAAPDSHLHLWITNGFLPEFPRIFAAWGFEFRSKFTWIKPHMGLGNYWRNSDELLLTGIRGNAKRFNDHSLKSWGEFPRTKHSAKPAEVRRMVERASLGPRLELFARGMPPHGWQFWGHGAGETEGQHESPATPALALAA